MIPARKTALFGWWFSRHAEQRIRGHFRAVELAGLDALAAQLVAGPVLVVANHSSWWDPLWIIALSHRLLRVDGYAMMDAQNLRRLPFFAKVGAFGVDRARPEDGAQAVRYAARLLSGPRRLVFVFPQGEERASTQRPLGFSAGSAVVARLAARAVTVPLAIRYEHGREERPTLIASLGAPVERRRDPEAGRAAHEAAVTTQLDRIDRYLRSGEDAAAFCRYWSATPSRATRWAERMLARVSRSAARER